MAFPHSQCHTTPEYLLLKRVDYSRMPAHTCSISTLRGVAKLLVGWLESRVGCMGRRLLRGNFYIHCIQIKVWVQYFILYFDYGTGTVKYYKDKIEIVLRNILFFHTRSGGEPGFVIPILFLQGIIILDLVDIRLITRSQSRSFQLHIIIESRVCHVNL